MSKEIRQMIDKVKNFKHFVNEDLQETLNKYLVSWDEFTWTVVANNEDEAKQFVIDDELFLKNDDEKSLDNRKQLQIKLLKSNILGTKVKGITKKSYNDFYDGKYRHIKRG